VGSNPKSQITLTTPLSSSGKLSFINPVEGKREGEGEKRHFLNLSGEQSSIFYLRYNLCPCLNYLNISVSLIFRASLYSSENMM